VTIVKWFGKHCLVQHSVEYGKRKYKVKQGEVVRVHTVRAYGGVRL